jgi:hypothetical protein
MSGDGSQYSGRRESSRGQRPAGERPVDYFDEPRRCRPTASRSVMANQSRWRASESRARREGVPPPVAWKGALLGRESATVRLRLRAPHNDREHESACEPLSPVDSRRIPA